MSADHVPYRDDVITSSANPTIRFARSLHRKRVRQRERALLVEGVRAILTAVEHGASLRTLLIDAENADNIDEPLLTSLRERTQRALLVDHSLFLQVAETEHPQPVVAICDIPNLRIPQDSTFVVALDGVRDPGNVGTLIRSSAAAGADGIVLLPGCVDPWNAKVVRAAAGIVFAIPVAQFDSVDQIITRCFTDRPRVAISDASAEHVYDEVDWRGATIVIVGGEAEGVSKEARTYADVSIRIPMKSGIESVNAGVAGSIIAFEIARQRRGED